MLINHYAKPTAAETSIEIQNNVIILTKNLMAVNIPWLYDATSQLIRNWDASEITLKPLTQCMGHNKNNEQAYMYNVN